MKSTSVATHRAVHYCICLGAKSCFYFRMRARGIVAKYKYTRGSAAMCDEQSLSLAQSAKLEFGGQIVRAQKAEKGKRAAQTRESSALSSTNPSSDLEQLYREIYLAVRSVSGRAEQLLQMWPLLSDTNRSSSKLHFTYTLLQGRYTFSSRRKLFKNQFTFYSL